MKDNQENLIPKGYTEKVTLKREKAAMNSWKKKGIQAAESKQII